MLVEVDSVVQLAAERLSRATGAEAVILFGSRARGDHDSDSDWDLCVVLPEDIEPARFTPVTLWHVISDLHAGVQVYPIRKSVLDAKRMDPNSVSHEIAQDGLTLIGNYDALVSSAGVP